MIETCWSGFAFRSVIRRHCGVDGGNVGVHCGFAAEASACSNCTDAILYWDSWKPLEAPGTFSGPSSLLSDSPATFPYCALIGRHPRHLFPAMPHRVTNKEHRWLFVFLFHVFMCSQEERAICPCACTLPPPPTGPTGWHSVIWSLAQAMTECEPAGGGGVCGFSAGQTHKIEGSNDRNQAARVGGGVPGHPPSTCLPV